MIPTCKPALSAKAKPLLEQLASDIGATSVLGVVTLEPNLKKFNVVTVEYIRVCLERPAPAPGDYLVVEVRTVDNKRLKLFQFHGNGALLPFSMQLNAENLEFNVEVTLAGIVVSAANVRVDVWGEKH